MVLLAFHLTGVGALAPPAYCTRECGGVKIPYPFGVDIEDGCQINETRYRQGFKLACRDFNGGRGKRLYYYNNEVLDISLQNGQVRWLNNISSYCYNATTGGMEVKSPPAHLDLNGAIFRLSYTANKFTVIGCKTLAYVGETNNVSSYAAVCGASCKSDNIPSLTTGTCEGIGCCQTAIPKGQENYHVWFDKNFTKEPEKGITGCSYAALVEESNFTFSASYLTSSAFMDTYSGQAPLMLDWAVGTLAGETCESARAKPKSYACVSDNSVCVDSPITGGGYICNCSQGYQGNPYLELQDGCQGTIAKIVGSVLLLLAVLSGIFFFYRWKRDIKKQQRKMYFRKNHGLLLEQLILSDENARDKTMIFSLEELEKATNNFDETRIVGRGGHGMVYIGILSDRRVVAIKKAKLVEETEISEFINEVVILSQINHRHIVKLYGCCLETEVPLLVSDFIPNGSLFKVLHAESGTRLPLSWDDCLRIALEAAGALCYLHTSASISVFHRDVKSSNILLDGNYTAKVSDFGASRTVPIHQTHVTTNIQGTYGYLDPEYYQTGKLNEKSDVYSFGVVLVELLTRKKPVLTTSSADGESHQNLSIYFISEIKTRPVRKVVAPEILEESNEDEINTVASLAEMCLRLKGEERPTMKQVESTLHSLRTKRLTFSQSSVSGYKPQDTHTVNKDHSGSSSAFSILE
ncbi:hypothetical protein QYE76_036771 [Lolium multiflorum]|uniref:Protein kinase domain-containing protein n=1 Tax=Lolium multiflorum TaxID=4521 RepID=A0AAD8VQJ0_LOLMU|nr:hypothetical protein QYE76_036771 [Lolium multiflorum]